MILYFSPEKLEEIRENYGVGCFEWHLIKDDDGSEYSQKKWTAYGNAPVPGEDLLCSAARLRYSVQIPDRRCEIKTFSSALHDAVFEWEVPPLVKKILTLVRSATRSGRAYGMEAAVDHNTPTLKIPNSLAGDVFWGYEPPFFREDALPRRSKRYTFEMSPYLERITRRQFRSKRTVLCPILEEEEFAATGVMEVRRGTSVRSTRLGGAVRSIVSWVTGRSL